MKFSVRYFLTTVEGVLKLSEYSSNVRSHLQNKFHEELEHLQCVTLPLTVLELRGVIQGRIQDFHGGGGRKCLCVCVRTYMTSAKRGVPYKTGVQCILKGPGSSRVLDALSCYLSLIIKHSDTKWDKKNIVDQSLGERVCCCHPPPPPVPLRLNIIILM